MKITHYKKVKAEKIEEPEAKGVRMRWVIKKEDGAPNFALRVPEIKPGGHTPYHSHKWEHEVFVKKGRGKLLWEGKTYPLKEGDVIFIPGGEKHQFLNNSRAILEFICVIPIE
ncbi:MAG: cupin domain-containing protein [candidate division Zixibacteria bacterium]|nr:cupin domain-containing protein [candidate division Zixibacteria bacterium]